ncbi:MAG: hypothetical protein EXS67_03900 [Candidatus Margulisbacteria bacterium]|nr:hypothetical protein [Candidatus Margulisiibacteriota bacterium]
MKKSYTIIESSRYLPNLPILKETLSLLQENRVTYKNEIHRDSRFAICHYKIAHENGHLHLYYDADKSAITTNQKKANTPPDLLACDAVKSILMEFLTIISDSKLTKAEVKLIQTDVFPFEFNPHRDSQFGRLRHIKYLATVLISCSGIDGGNMQLFYSDNDMRGPFDLLEELPATAGAGYIVDETSQKIFHGMKPAYKIKEGAHRAALLVRFFE